MDVTFINLQTGLGILLERRNLQPRQRVTINTAVFEIIIDWDDVGPAINYAAKARYASRN